jgi:hypothetical protein
MPLASHPTEEVTSATTLRGPGISGSISGRGRMTRAGTSGRLVTGPVNGWTRRGTVDACAAVAATRSTSTPPTRSARSPSPESRPDLTGTVVTEMDAPESMLAAEWSRASTRD